MDKQPKIIIKPTQADKIIESIGYLILISFWIMNIVSFYNLPDTIPIHYNGSGEIDSYGSKSTIFLLPIIGTFLFIFLTVLNKYPENFNYIVKITQENAEKQYINTTKIIRLFKIIILLLFVFIDFITIQASKGNPEGLGKWFLPFIAGLIFTPILYSIYKSNKLK